MRGPGGWVHLLSPEPVPHVLVKVKEGELHPGDNDRQAGVAPHKLESKIDRGMQVRIDNLNAVADIEQSVGTIRIASAGNSARGWALHVDLEEGFHGRAVTFSFLNVVVAWGLGGSAHGALFGGGGTSGAGAARTSGR